MDELKDQRQEPFGQPNQIDSEISYTAWFWAGGLILAAGLVYLLWRLWKSWGYSRIPTWIESTLLRIGVRPPEKIHSWALHSRLPPMSRAYNEINQALTRLGRPAQDHDTPSERAGALVEILPDAETPALVLVSEYQRTIFSPREGNTARGEIAGDVIRKLSLQAKWNQQKEKLLKPFKRSKRG